MKTESLLVLSIALVLSACATAPNVAEKQQSAAPVVEANTGPGSKSAGTPPTASGGYLPGDGPGADVPNLDNIPDAVPKAEPLHRYANRPYTALGKTYKPLQVTGNYKERGIASWYGKKFNGQRTSIGETYNMYEMTAAHPTLPIPSYARVTNVANGKSVIVRINDRGPFLHERIMDLSYVAAYKLGFINTGSAEVEVESIAAGDNTPGAVETAVVKAEPVTVTPIAPAATTIPVDTVSSSVGKVFLQLGAFKSAQGAESFLSKMSAELGDSGKELKLYEKNGLTRVHLGPYASANEAHDAASSIAAKLGFKPLVSMH